jgi:hypothetical protein
MSHEKTHLYPTLTEDEQRQIHAGLRSSNAFVLRRCQILWVYEKVVGKQAKRGYPHR